MWSAEFFSQCSNLPLLPCSNKNPQEKLGFLEQAVKQGILEVVFDDNFGKKKKKKKKFFFFFYDNFGKFSHSHVVGTH